jgi:hypothetical protein
MNSIFDEELSMRLKSLLPTFLLIASMSVAQTTVSVAPDAASKEDVKRLFDVMASRDQMAQMMQQLFAQMQSLSREEMKKRHPEVTDAELARMDRQSEELIKNFPLDAMLSDMVPVYQKHFTKSDIDALIVFYGSPTGQKFLHEMPAVTAETMRAVYPKIQSQVNAALKAADKNDSTEK